MWPISATFDLRPDDPNSRMSAGRVRARVRRRAFDGRAGHLVRRAAADLLQHALRRGRVEDQGAPDEAGAVEAAVRLADRLVVGAAPDVGHADLLDGAGDGRVAQAGRGRQAGELGDDGARVVAGHAVQHPRGRPRGVGARGDLGVAALQPVGAGRDVVAQAEQAGDDLGAGVGARAVAEPRRAGRGPSCAVGARPSAATNVASSSAIVTGASVVGMSTRPIEPGTAPHTSIASVPWSSGAGRPVARSGLARQHAGADHRGDRGVGPAFRARCRSRDEREEEDGSGDEVAEGHNLPIVGREHHPTPPSGGCASPRPLIPQKTLQRCGPISRCGRARSGSCRPGATSRRCRPARSLCTLWTVILREIERPRISDESGTRRATPKRAPSPTRRPRRRCRPPARSPAGSVQSPSDGARVATVDRLAAPARSPSDAREPRRFSVTQPRPGRFATRSVKVCVAVSQASRNPDCTVDRRAAVRPDEIIAIAPALGRDHEPRVPQRELRRRLRVADHDARVVLVRACRCPRTGSSPCTCRTPRRPRAAPAGARAPRAMCGSLPSRRVIGAEAGAGGSPVRRIRARARGRRSGRRRPRSRPPGAAGRPARRPPSSSALGELAVAGRGGVRDARDDAAQRRRALDQPRAVHDGLAAGAATGHLERQHAAEAAVQQPRRRARAAGATAGPGRAPRRRRRGSRASRRSPARSRTGAPCAAPACACRGAAATRCPGSATPPVSISRAAHPAEVVGAAADGAGEHVVVAVQELRRGVQHHVRAVREGLAEQRRGERRVDDQPRPGGQRDQAERVEVGDRGAGVRDRLAVDGVGAVGTGRLDRRRDR